MDILPDGTLDYDDEVLAQRIMLSQLFIKTLINLKTKS